MPAWISLATFVYLLTDCLRCHLSISSSMSSGPAGTIISLRSFSDKDFLYVSLAFFHAVSVAVSADLKAGEEARLIGDGARVREDFDVSHDAESIAVFY